MSTPICTQSVTVLRRMGVALAGSPLRFTNHDDDGGSAVLWVEADLWQSMGSPGTLTVTIQPGDLLNAPEEGVGGHLPAA